MHQPNAKIGITERQLRDVLKRFLAARVVADAIEQCRAVAMAAQPEAKARTTAAAPLRALAMTDDSRLLSPEETAKMASHVLAKLRGGGAP